MNPLDALLAEALSSVIKKNLGARTLKRIEKRLQEKYGYTMTMSIKNFHTLDATLREFFGPTADRIEKDFVNGIFGTDTKNGDMWITIQNKELAELVLESFGNKEKRKILEYSFTNSTTLSKILKSCEIPKSSGYRLINELIQRGLLVADSYVSDEGKEISRYTSIFNGLDIHIKDNTIVVNCLFKKNFLKNSYIMKLVHNENN